MILPDTAEGLAALKVAIQEQMEKRGMILPKAEGHKRLDPHHSSGKASAWNPIFAKRQERLCPMCDRPSFKFNFPPYWCTYTMICIECNTVMTGNSATPRYALRKKNRRAPNLSVTS